MPVYVYRCRDCGSQIERRQSFSDAPLSECDSCGGRLQKVLQPTMIIYKGSGFYSTDHRSTSGGNGHNGSATQADGTGKAEAAGKGDSPGKESGAGTGNGTDKESAAGKREATRSAKASASGE